MKRRIYGLEQHEPQKDYSILLLLMLFLTDEQHNKKRPETSKEYKTQKPGLMFDRRKKRTARFYDKAGKIPVIRSSICTGEQVAGFKDPVSGKFDELMLIRGGSDLAEFYSQCQVDENDIHREW